MIEKIFYVVVYVVVTAAIALLAAQAAVFGLAQFHVDSGLLGPWLLIEVAAYVVRAGQPEKK